MSWKTIQFATDITVFADDDDDGDEKDPKPAPSKTKELTVSNIRSAILDVLQSINLDDFQVQESKPEYENRHWSNDDTEEDIKQTRIDHFIESCVGRLTPLLHDWKAELSKPKPMANYLAYLLDEDYTDEFGDTSLDHTLDKLQAKDGVTGRVVERACAEAGFSLFLTTFRRNVEAIDDEHKVYSDFEERSESEEEYEVIYELGTILDPSGEPVCKVGNMPTTTASLVQHTFFNDFADDETASLQVLLLVPDFHMFIDTLIDLDQENAKDLLSYTLPKFRAASSDKHELGATVRKICMNIIAKEESILKQDSHVYHSWSRTLVPVSRACIAMDDMPLLKRALRCFQDASLDAFSELRWILEQVPFEHVLEGLNTAIASYKTFGGRYQATQRLFDGGAGLNLRTMEQERDTDLGKWFVAKMEELITPKRILVKSAYIPLMQFIALQGQCDAYFMKRLMPILVRSASETPFIISLLNKIWDDPWRLTKDTIATIFQYLVPLLRDTYNLVKWSRDGFEDWKTKETRFTTKRDLGYRIHLAPLDGHELASFIDHCLELGLVEDTLVILKKFMIEVDQLCPADFELTVLPCLQGLATSLFKRNEASSPGHQKMFKHILNVYLERCVQKEPTSPSNWARAPVNCRCHSSYPGRMCSICLELNAFLKDPESRELDLEISKHEHNHIIDEMEKAKTDCDTSAHKPGKRWHLRFRKTKEQYHEAYEIWEGRRREAGRQLRAFDQDALKQLLGDQYDHILKMRSVRLPTTDLAAEALPLQSTAANVGRVGNSTAYTRVAQPTASLKRKNEIIDLTEDGEENEEEDKDEDIATKRPRLSSEL